MASYVIRAGWFGWSGIAGGGAVAPAGGVIVKFTAGEALRNSPQPAAAQFQAIVNGLTRAITGVAVGGPNNQELTVTLATPNLSAGQPVVITYTPGATASTRLAYASGEELAGSTRELLAA